MASFQRPVGAPADLHELEYVAALHQTCMPACRENGTVSSVDICRFLRSRMGVKISHEEALRIVRAFGGGVISEDVVLKILGEPKEDESLLIKEPEAVVEKKRLRSAALTFKNTLMRKKSKAETEDADDLQEEPAVDEEEEDRTDDVMEGEEPEEYLDLVQFLAALLMPTLARSGAEWRAQEVFDDEEPPEDSDLLKVDESLRPKPENLFHASLSALLSTIPNRQEADDGTTTYPKLTPELVKELLTAHGELERAADSKLIESMVEIASSPSGLLDEEALVNAMTADLAAYKVGCEDQETTPFYDVFGFESFQEGTELQEETKRAKAREDKENRANGDDDRRDAQDEPVLEEKEERGSGDVEKTSSPDQEKLVPFDFIPSLPAIDFAIDAHLSMTIVVFIWGFFFLTALTYAAMIQTLEPLQPDCDSSTFGCQITGTIRTWLTFAAILVALGLVMIIPLSVGNTPRRRSPKTTLFSFLCSIFYTWLPYAAVELYERRIEDPKNDTEEFVTATNWDVAQWFVRVFGNLLCLFYLLQFILALIGARRIRESALLSRWFTPSNVRGLARIKRSATRKINSLLENAHTLHSPRISGRPSISARSSLRNDTATEETMVNFVVHGHRTEPCGGLVWTWRLIFTGDLFNVEGVWLMDRLIVFQVIQAVIIVFVVYGLSIAIEAAADAADEANDDLADDLPDWVYDIVPTGNQTRGALYPALGVSALVMVTLLLLYIPSYVSQTLMYRCGMIPSLKSPYFTQFRGNVDLVYGNIGNAVYAMFGAGILFFAGIGLVLFLFIWEFTRGLMLLIVAWGIGLTITIVLKMLLTKACRTRFYNGFYRVRPAAANLSTLALECWFIGLGGGVLIGRFTQFIGAACFWVGRTDVPFLSEDVNLMGYAFDYVPTNFRKDLLVHDAHQHPFIVRMFTMYLLKLKDDGFCRAAGACWRQLFVVSWMPWMMKERVFLDKRLETAIESYNKRRMELEEENKQLRLGERITEEISSGMKDMADQVIDKRPSVRKE